MRPEAPKPSRPSRGAAFAFDQLIRGLVTGSLCRYGRDLEDQKKRDESSLEALGFKSMDWRLAEKGNNLAAAWEGVRSCQNTLALMSEFAAPPPDQPDVPKAYGTLDFPTSIGQAPYMLLHSSKFQGGPACLPLVQLLIEYLGLKPPRLIVSCIGAETENQIDIIQKVGHAMSRLRHFSPRGVYLFVLGCTFCL